MDFGGYKTWVREVGKKSGSGGGLLGLFGKSPDKSQGYAAPIRTLRTQRKVWLSHLICD